MDLSLTVLRVVQEVAESGSFTAAAARLGYTQSAVSRQVSTAERALGAPLFDRVRGGVRLTDAGRVAVRQVAVALAALETARAEISGVSEERVPLRLGYFASAGSVLVPRALAALGRDRPDLDISTREVTTPAAVRALRSGSLDLALITSRPPHRAPDQDEPPLPSQEVGTIRLALAVPALGDLAGRRSVAADELAGVSWVASPGSADEPLLGTWPGLPHRPRASHSARDWATKLALVASGVGVTTVPAQLLTLPEGVTTVSVAGVPDEVRRLVLVARPDVEPELSSVLARALSGALSPGASDREGHR